MRKTRKSVSTRVKITKRGKMKRRKMALGHFRAKKSGTKTQKKRMVINVSRVNSKTLRKYLT